MTDKQIKEINEQIKKAIQSIKNIWKKYDELREKYKAKEQECEYWKHQAELGVDTTNRLTKELKETEEECEELKLYLIEAKAHSDYLNNLALSETLNLVSEQLDQLKAKLSKLKSRILCENEDDLLYELMQIIEE